MKTLSIDIETYSSTDIKAGVYKYVEAPDFEILLFSYSFDGGPVQTLDLTGVDFSMALDRYDLNPIETIDEQLAEALTAPAILKTAYNANFERTCIAKFFGIACPPEQWTCTRVKAGMLGLPMNLETVAKALKLEQQKNTDGKALIRYFSIPCKPTKANGGRTRNLPEHAPEKWEKYKQYNADDVRTELAVLDRISFFTVPPFEQKLWCLDQKINDRGAMVDVPFVENAIKFDTEYKERLTVEAIELTGLKNPNSAAQLKVWLNGAMVDEVTKLRKEDISELLELSDSGGVTRVLELRQEMSKTSVKKYHAMLGSVNSDARIRGLFQFYGANRTGRFAGRIVQVQNLPRNYLSELDLARCLVSDDNLETLELLFGNVPDTLSQLIRTAFVAPPGHRFIVSDFSSIELVVAAWLANETWVITEFNGARKIYEQTAARMLNVDVKTIGKSSPERQKGKIASLACQYGGGVGALVKMGAVRMGLDEEELPDIVSKWRKANSNIVNYWYTLEKAALRAVRDGEIATLNFGMKFFVRFGILFLKLPSGRHLCYYNPTVKPGKFGNDTVFFYGMDQTTKQWCLQDSYGGKWFENLCQAIARDCLAVSLLALSDAGYNVTLHVHDENVLEAPDHFGSLEEVNKIMSTPISWAPGLPLSAEGFEAKYYQK